MNQVGCAPAVSTNFVRLTIASLIAVGVFAVGLLVGPATASADGTSVNNCSNVAVNVACFGQINGNPVTINIGDVASNNQLNVLTSNLQNVFLSVVNIQDINILSADLNTAVQTVVNTVFNTTTTAKACTVFVTPPTTITQTSAIAISCS
jgi:hypothetical protein